MASVTRRASLSSVLSGVNVGSPRPRKVSPATSRGLPSSTTAFGTCRIARWVTRESWLPRTQTYGAGIRRTSSTYRFSARLPWSVMSPESTMTSTSYCCATVEITSHACGARCRSETCSTFTTSSWPGSSGSEDVAE